MKYLLLCLSVLVLAGCNAPISENEQKLNEFVAGGEPFAWDMIEEETEAYTLTYPQLTSGPGVIVESVNSGMRSAAESFVEQAEAWATEVAADPDLEMPGPWILAIDPMYKFQDETFMSLQLNTYDYSGGAHGNSYYGVLNYHPDSATFITLPDLFTGDDYLEVVAAFVKSEVALIKAARTENYDAASDDFLQDGTVPDVKNFKTFVFVDGPEGRGLMFLFAPYQLGAYVEGGFEILVPVGILADFVKPEYKDWFVPEPALDE